MEKIKVRHADLIIDRQHLAARMGEIILDIIRLSDGAPMYIPETHHRAGGMAFALTNVLERFKVAYTKSGDMSALTEIKSAVNEMVKQIGSLFSGRVLAGQKSRTPEERLFQDTFKGIWNAGKMMGRGLRTEEAFNEKILYNGKETVFHEILKNINNSEYLLSGIGYDKKAEETDFSGMDLEETADTLIRIMAEKALPPQCELFKDDLAEFIFDNAQYAGNLERIIQEKDIRRGKGL
jgi:hypothetical protein